MINTIKQMILQKDAGSFQILCDTILAKEGYNNILSLGTHAGTQKTTPGTPDTYFFDNDNKKYIFVEYTTQENGLASKIENDIEKCLDVTKTGIPTNEISEIIYFHTSSNIAPKDDKRIREKCNKSGVALSFRGIDQLSYDLYLKHRSIARDLLSVSIDTDQIKDLEDFIQTYDENRLAAPINNDFLFREKELVDIEDAFKTENVVIVSGPSGVGKTKLCIHFSEKYAKKQSRKLFCIRANALPIYEDLKLYLDKPGKYFIFVDDANQLNGLQYVIPYATMQDKGYDVKIIVSVRDYAVDKLRHDIKSFSSFSEVSVGPFKREEIEQLLKNEFGINNFLYLDRIVKISEGNARLAMLAGKISSDTNRLDSINDASQLYDEYYRAIIKDNELFDDPNVLIVAGIISVFKAIHLDNIEIVLPLLENHNISKEVFVECIRKLHECEIVDVYYDKAVKLTEQCLSNFLLKYVFYDKKTIELAELIEFGFFKFKQKTIEAINTLLNIFKSDDIIAFTEKHIKSVWQKLKKEDYAKFFEFVKAFYLISPTESLLLVQEIIKNIKTVDISIDDIDVNDGKNYKKVDDDVINILLGFTNDDNCETALDLLFEYYFKRPDLFIQFYHGINIYFGINRFSSLRKYDLQIKLFENIKKNSKNWENEYVNLLFFELVPKFLTFTFSSAEVTGERSITCYNLHINNDIIALEYRILLWNTLVEFSKTTKYQPKVYRILNEYSSYICKESQEIIERERKYIIDIFNELPYKESLIVNILAQQINKSIVRRELKKECIIPELYIDSDKMPIYSLLNKGDFEPGVSYKEREEQKKSSIKASVKKETNIIITMIDVCKELSECPFEKNFYTVSSGLGIAFEETPNDKTILPLVKYYLNADTPLDLHPRYIIEKMLKCASPQEVFRLINEQDYRNRNTWNYEYYYQLPEEYVTVEELKNLYIFLDDITGFKSTAYPLRDISFIKKFNKICSDAFEKCCRIILSKKDYLDFIPCVYFELLFNEYRETSKETIELFKDNIGLLIDIYIYIISVKKDVDESGIFLKKIYYLEKSILDRYIDFIITVKTIHYDAIYHRICSLFEVDEYKAIFDYVICRITKEKEYPAYEMQKLMSSLITPDSDKQELLQKQDSWIRDFMLNNIYNSTEIECLFEAILQLEDQRRKKYLLMFIEKNPDYEIFDNLKLIPTSYSWTGSRVPILSGFINFLNSLLPHLNGIKYLKHRDKVIKMIESCYISIEEDEIREVITN